MPTPSLTYVNRIQNRVRWGPPGTNFDEFLDDFLPYMTFWCDPGAGEQIRFASMAAAFSPSTLANFTAVGSPPTTGTPSNESLDFTLFRLTSLSAVDIILQRANQQPNSVLHDDHRFRRMAILRVMSGFLWNGDGTTQWLGVDTAGFPRTVIPGLPGVTPVDVLATLRLIDDTVLTHELGRRASCFVTTPRGRQNIEAAMEQSGFAVVYDHAPGVPNPVPFYRGKPVLATQSLNQVAPDREPVFGYDGTQAGMFCTSGSPASMGIASAPMPLQNSGNVGELQYVHGAVVAMTDHAWVKSDITNTLSPV
jgi:hypothetical protein